MSRARTKLSLVPTTSTDLSKSGDVRRSKRPIEINTEVDDDDFALPPGFEFPGEARPGCDRWCAPLHLVDKAVNGKPWAKYFDPNDFMIMSRLTDSRGTITHYKHIDTRRYINVDDFGKTYVYNESDFQNADKRYGYSNSKRLRAAMEQLGLWELPWMREEYFDDRLGLEWDDRWRHPNAPKRSPKTYARN